MKYIITESKLNKLIRDYLDENYGDLNWTYASDDNGDETDCAIQFYEGDYSDEEVKFRFYDKCWWNIHYGEPSALIMYEKSPILIFEKEYEFEKLNSYFGETWIPVFKKWFSDTFKIPVKTVEY